MSGARQGDDFRTTNQGQEAEFADRETWVLGGSLASRTLGGVGDFEKFQAPEGKRAKTACGDGGVQIVWPSTPSTCRAEMLPRGKQSFKRWREESSAGTREARG